MTGGTAPAVTDTPLVSVVTIFLDAGKFIREAIESVLGQTWEHWELLLVDDGSTDGSTAIVRDYARRFPERIRTLEHEGHANRGMGLSRNLGVAHANGEFITFLDADDVLLPHALEEEVAILKAQPDAAMVYGRTERWYGWTGDPEEVKRDFLPDLCTTMDAVHQPPTLLSLCLRNEYAVPAICSVMIRREAILRLGGFEDDFRTGDDQTLHAKVFLEEPVFVSSRCFSRYRQHPDMTCVKGERAGQWEGHAPNPVRFRYLTWAERYMSQKGFRGTEVWRHLQRELLPYRHGLVHRVLRASKALGQATAERRREVMWRLFGRPHGSLSADPNPIHLAAGDRYGRTALSWNAEGTDSVEVRIDAPDGSLFASSGPAGTASTGPWVSDGMMFFLQNVSSGRPLTAANTLAVLRAEVPSGKAQSTTLMRNRVLRMLPAALRDRLRQRIEGEKFTPAPGRVDFGGLKRLTPIDREWGFSRGKPVSRFYIERFLERHAADVHGRVLEIGDDAYTRRFGAERVTRSDVLNFRDGLAQTTIVADLADAPHIPSNTFDCIIFTQTLQFIYDARAAVRTLYRILKPGGVILATVPGVTPTCGSWAESTCWKFTSLSARRSFEEAFPAESIEVASYGNVLIAVAALHGLTVSDVPAEALDHHDAGYEIVISVRAVKPAESPRDRA